MNRVACRTPNMVPIGIILALVGLTTMPFTLAGAGTATAAPPKMKMTTDIPASIITPDQVKTRIGTLEFFDGFPTEATAGSVSTIWTSCVAWRCF